MCDEHEGGQNGQGDGPEGGGPKRDELWRLVPVPEQRDFVKGLIQRHRLRHAAQALGLKREALRLFANGKTEVPNDHTREAIGRAYLVWKEGNFAVAEKRHAPSLPTPADLRVALPEGREPAHAALKDMLERLEREAKSRGEELKPYDPMVISFIRRCVDLVYQQEPTVYEQKRPGRGPAAPPPAPEKPPPGKKPKRKKKKDEEEDG